MAAFIRKLFKTRKATQAPAPKQVTPSPVAQPRDNQGDLKTEQDAILNAQPTLQQLETLAIEGVTSDIRQRAATDIADREALNRIQKAAKGKDKGVYQLVRHKLQQIKQQETEQNQLQERLQTLIRQAEDQARSEDTNLYEPRFEALLQQWQPLEPEATPEQAAAFLQACHGCRERIAALAAEAADQQRHADQAQQRISTIELLNTTLDDLRTAATTALPSLSALDALQKTQENRWLEATRDTQVQKSEQKQYEASMQNLKSFLGAVRRYSAAGESLQALLEQVEDDALKPDQKTGAQALVADIDWPTGFANPEPLQRLSSLLKTVSPRVERSGDDEQQKQRAKALADILDQLEQALESRQLKESRQLFKKAQQTQKNLDKRHARSLQARLQLLAGQLHDLNDWQGFATSPKQQALCEQMEYLAEQPMEPEAKAERIKELQTEWRKLGGSSDRTLWDRFKKASDAAYEPCKAYFSAKSDLKQSNLDKRGLICDELDNFVTNSDLSDADWKAVDQILRTARDEWKAAWPVEFRDNRSVQKRFDSLLKRLEAPLNAEREKNEALKQAIIERAEALVELEPLAEAMNQAKALQGEWQAVGITRHREDRKLWKAFRSACDRIFERRDAERSTQQQQTEAADKHLEEVLGQTAEVNATQASAAAIAEALKTLDTVAGQRLSRPMSERLSSERARLKSLKEQQALADRIASWHHYIDASQDNPAELSAPEAWARRSSALDTLSARELVIRAEILSEVPSPDQDQALRMEIQVKRLSDGLGGGQTESNHADQLESLVAYWCLGLDHSDRQPEMATRLKQALTATLR
ncbi:DUF349 domain-containing protein [Marinobacter zhejiangensis]|uniref:DUF349 domain-containing protein n=1 Tax=Marinobacter zhejiangensis TaxID=488535 RepID=A0A1I4QW20_9GAMM|nr:DUF349 domain-containing protein [Marinobacter zhejiangensis]SFM44249.1 protein of unknown function [Marinobacter zhejiangensis]